ncbi:acylneuraminate cytidylyltransferase family protein, partial [Dissulfurispira sp.]|uniref:acylneuraminate cytidylyltransferase family protein n=1 Tax=Dissulfurispira sp. TaxID=2817609 RepID=UPI002FDACA9C
MNVLGIVPARGGSKRIPQKNLYPLGGIPLISHCLRTAKKSSLINRLVVSTEDEAIAEVAKKEGIEVIKRPVELAQDNTPTLPVIKHAINELDKEGFYADIILTIQPTYPFITVENIEKTIKAFSVNGDFDSVTTVTRAPFKYHPYNARKINEDGTISFMFPEEKKKCPNSQSAPPVYFFGNLYASKRATIFEKDSLYGDISFPAEIDTIEGFDIDDMFDMEMAEWLMSR